MLTSDYRKLAESLKAARLPETIDQRTADLFKADRQI